MSVYLATARFAHPSDETGQEPTIDLLFATTGIEREIVDEAAPVEIVPGDTILVARLPHLIAMKTLSERQGRERDRDDLRELLAAANESEIGEARQLLTLIKDRGFDREKDLQGRLATSLAEMKERQHRRQQDDQNWDEDS